MKALKIIGIIILGIIALFFIIAAFLPKSIYLEQSIDIKAPSDVVFDQVNDLEAWENWSPFVDDDETARIEYGEKTSGKDASYSWYTDKGDGILRISESEPSKYIKNEIEFIGMGSAYGTWTFEEVDETTTLTWGFGKDDLGIPAGRWYGLMMKYTMIPYLQKGLANIKEIAESIPPAPKATLSEIEEMKMPPQMIISISDSLLQTEMDDYINNAFARVGEFIKMYDELQVTGPQFVAYHNWDTAGKSLLEVGYPVNMPYNVSDDMVCREMPGSDVVYVSFFGPNELNWMAHIAIEDYMQEMSLEMMWPVLEIYVSGYDDERNIENRETQIVYPVKPAEPDED